MASIIQLIGALGQGWMLGQEQAQKRQLNKIRALQLQRQSQHDALALYKQAIELQNQGSPELAAEVLKVARSYDPRMPSKLPDVLAKKAREAMDARQEIEERLAAAGLQPGTPEYDAYRKQALLRTTPLAPIDIGGQTVYAPVSAMIGQNRFTETHPVVPGPVAERTGIPPGTRVAPQVIATDQRQYEKDLPVPMKITVGVARLYKHILPHLWDPRWESMDDSKTINIQATPTEVGTINQVARGIKPPKPVGYRDIPISDRAKLDEFYKAARGSDFPEEYVGPKPPDLGPLREKLAPLRDTHGLDIGVDWEQEKNSEGLPVPAPQGRVSHFIWGTQPQQYKWRLKRKERRLPKQLYVPGMVVPELPAPEQEQSYEQ